MIDTSVPEPLTKLTKEEIIQATLPTLEEKLAYDRAVRDYLIERKAPKEFIQWLFARFLGRLR